MPTGPDLPSTAMLMRIAADHGLDLTTADADSYRALMAGAIEFLPQAGGILRAEAAGEISPRRRLAAQARGQPVQRLVLALQYRGRGERRAPAGDPAGRHTRRRQSIPGLVRLEPDGRRGPHRARHPGCARPGAAMGNHGAPACGRAITVAPARVTAALVILGGCFWALSQVLTRIPMGVAYAIWSGAGIALICVARLARAQASGPAHELRRRHTTVDC